MDPKKQQIGGTPDNPEYYRVGGIEAIDYIRAKATPRELIGYAKWSIVHYASRMAYKHHGADEHQDALKVRWYANLLVEALETEKQSATETR